MDDLGDYGPRDDDEPIDLYDLLIRSAPSRTGLTSNRAPANCRDGLGEMALRSGSASGWPFCHHYCRSLFSYAMCRRLDGDPGLGRIIAIRSAL